jgi:hypothetical protein
MTRTVRLSPASTLAYAHSIALVALCVLVCCWWITCSSHTVLVALMLAAQRATAGRVSHFRGLTHNDTHALLRVLFSVHYGSGSSRCNLLLDKLLQWLCLTASTVMFYFESGHAVLALWCCCDSCEHQMQWCCQPSSICTAQCPPLLRLLQH